MDSIFIQDRTQSLDLEHAQIQLHSLACWFCVEVNFTIPAYDIHGVADEQKYALSHTKHMCPSELSLYAIILVSDYYYYYYFFFFFLGGGGVISLNVIDLFTSPQFLSRTRHQLANPPPPPPPPFFFSFLISIPMSLVNVGKSKWRDNDVTAWSEQKAKVQNASSADTIADHLSQLSAYKSHYRKCFILLQHSAYLSTCGKSKINSFSMLSMWNREKEA